MTATLTPSEDQVFDTVWGLVAAYLGPANEPAIFKGFQNVTATPPGNYAVIQPGVAMRQNQLMRDYDPVAGTQLIERSTTYSYQVDCYGPSAPDWANIIAIAWPTLWSIDNNAAPTIIVPLYADDPVQMNIINGELQYEQRFMLKLFGQVNQTVALPQDFFVNAPITGIVADVLSVV